MPRIALQQYKIVRLDSVCLHPDNPNQGDVETIGESIDRNDFYGAIVVQASSGRILAGNHRYLAAQAAGLEELPAIVIDVDDERAKRIMVSDNQLARLASWDEAQLVELLAELAVEPGELAGTGFYESDLLDMQRRTGALSDRATGFFDDYIGASGRQAPRGPGDTPQPRPAVTSGGGGPPVPGSPPATAGGDDFVSVAWTVTVDQRDVIRTALRRAQELKQLGTTAEALVAICADYAAANAA